MAGNVDGNQDAERERQHELEKAEREARNKVELDKQQHDHERDMARYARAHEALLTAQLNTQQTAQQRREHKVAWYATVWVPVILALGGGFLGGLATIYGKKLDQDVRNQVWEASHKDKEHAASALSELLKLQEEYIEKLKQAQIDQLALMNYAEQLKAKEHELHRLREEHRNALLNIRRRYAGLEAAERARQEASRASAEAKARREKWQAYGCRLDPVRQGWCSLGTRATFAPGTPDEKVVVQAQTVGSKPAVCRSHKIEDDEAAEVACQKYGTEVLRAKGVSDEDIKAILGLYSTNDVIRRFNDVLSTPLPEPFKQKAPTTTPPKGIEAIIGKPIEVD